MGVVADAYLVVPHVPDRAKTWLGYHAGRPALFQPCRLGCEATRVTRSSDCANQVLKTEQVAYGRRRLVLCSLATGLLADHGVISDRIAEVCCTKWER